MTDIDTNLQIVNVEIGSLTPYQRNARQHSESQIEQIMNSMREFGWTTPVIIDENQQIIAGHGRVEAAKRLGIERVPCISKSNLTQNQLRALVIADNKLAMNATWDWEMLRSEIGELKSSDVNLGLVGFTESELANLLVGLNDPEAEWKNMPEFTQPDAMAWRTLKVHFENQADLDKFAKLVKQKIGTDTRFIWYPEAKKVKVADKQYAAEKS